MAGPLDDLVGAGVRAWLAVIQASVEAANDIVVAWLELADVESGRPGFNEEIVFVPGQPGATPLHPTDFTDWDDNELPSDAFDLDPSDVKAGEATQVRLLVRPPQGAVSGTYTGSLCDSNGACLLDEVGVYVVGETPP
jgi:hypothetical protein